MALPVKIIRRSNSILAKRVHIGLKGTRIDVRRNSGVEQIRFELRERSWSVITPINSGARANRVNYAIAGLTGGVRNSEVRDGNTLPRVVVARARDVAHWVRQIILLKDLLTSTGVHREKAPRPPMEAPYTPAHKVKPSIFLGFSTFLLCGVFVLGTLPVLVLV